jgi:hypothetical protein
MSEAKPGEVFAEAKVDFEAARAHRLKMFEGHPFPKCPTCGGHNDHNRVGGFEFCPSCGNLIPPIKLPQSVKRAGVVLYRVDPYCFPREIRQLKGMFGR